MRCLVDENLPFSLIKLLRASQCEVLDVSAGHLRGSSDENLWKLAASENRVLITKDLDFPLPHIHPYPAGLVLIRVPDIWTGE